MTNDASLWHGRPMTNTPLDYPAGTPRAGLDARRLDASPGLRAGVLARFDSFTPDNEQQEAMAQSRATFRGAAEFILDNTITTREQSLALTALEEAKYWTNQAIAKHGLPDSV